MVVDVVVVGKTDPVNGIESVLEAVVVGDVSGTRVDVEEVGVTIVGNIEEVIIVADVRVVVVAEGVAEGVAEVVEVVMVMSAVH